MSTPPAKLTKSLALAERWAKDRGSSVERLNLQLQDGVTEPGLGLDSKTLPVMIRDSGKHVTVFAMFQVPEQVRAKLAAADGKARLEVLIRLRAELARSPRTAYSFQPQTIRGVEDITGIAVEQLVRISEDDPSSYNRFGDAIQEVRTVLLHAAVFLGFFGPPDTPPSTYTSPVPPPPGMFG